MINIIFYKSTRRKYCWVWHWRFRTRRIGGIQNKYSNFRRQLDALESSRTSNRTLLKCMLTTRSVWQIIIPNVTCVMNVKLIAFSIDIWNTWLAQNKYVYFFFPVTIKLSIPHLTPPLHTHTHTFHFHEPIIVPPPTLRSHIIQNARWHLSLAARELLSSHLVTTQYDIVTIIALCYNRHKGEN